MKELIERLERATGPDRVLADDVLLACGWVLKDSVWYISDAHAEHGAEPCWAECDNPPDPTSSIDAALTLVPRGFEWEIKSYDGFKSVSIGDPLLWMDGEHPTSVSIALCIAALKARHQTQGHHPMSALTEEERKRVEEIRAFASPYVGGELLAIIDRITSAAPAETLQADTAHHVERPKSDGSYGSGVGADAEAHCGSLPSVEPDAAPAEKVEDEVAEIEKHVLEDDTVPVNNNDELADRLERCLDDRATLLRILKSRKATGMVDREALARTLGAFTAADYKDHDDLWSEDWEAVRKAKYPPTWLHMTDALLSSGMIHAMPTREEIAKAVYALYPASDYHGDTVPWDDRDGADGPSYVDPFVVADAILALTARGR
jgi:hypothetical protein